MKIAVFTDAFSPQVNGVVTHLHSLLPLLAKNHTIEVFAPHLSPHLPPELMHDRISVSTYKGIPVLLYQDVLFTSPYYQSAYDRVVHFKPDIIHVHTPFTIGANGVIASRRLNIPLVHTFHTYVNEPEYLRHLKLHRIGLDKSVLVQKGVWAYLEFFYKPADIIICPSEMTTLDLQQRFPDKLVVTISNGINLEEYEITMRNKTAVQERFHIPGDYFIYIGRVSVEKNIPDLIDGFVSSGLAHKNVSLVIVGKGPYISHVKKHVEKAGITKNVIFTGELSHQEIVTSGILHNACAFVSMSTSETQGITFLEAMAAGLPLIVVDSKATSSLVHNNGIICPLNAKLYGKALRTIVENPEKRKKYAMQSKKNIEAHDIRTTITLMEDAYQKAISLHAHPDH